VATFNDQVYPASVLAGHLRGLIRDAERVNQELGHENFGALSIDHGLFPLSAPLLHHSEEFGAWDEAVSELPRLYSEMGLRRHLSGLPLLDATRLPEGELRRAATLLSIFAHSFRQITLDESVELPRSLAEPWETVCRRLHRKSMMMTYDDLILFNFKRRRDIPLAELRLEDMDLLVPAVGTDDERIFYLTQTEISARLAPVLRLYLDTAEAIEKKRYEDAEVALLAIRDCLVGVNEESLPKLKAAGRQRIRPVVWAKTVAPLAVATGTDEPGPSGTSNPAIHLIDAIVGRNRFSAELGREALALRECMPFHLRNLFLQLQDRSCLKAEIEDSGNRSLIHAYGELRAAYLGKNGFLHRHRVKVYGFIEVAFKVGREVTIGGFRGGPLDREWDAVDDALVAAEKERAPAGCPFHSSSSRGNKEPSSDSSGEEDALEALEDLWKECAALPVRSQADFYRAGLRVEDPVVRIHDCAVRLEKIARLHPGGREILTLYAGRDATSALRRVAHFQNPTVRRYLSRNVVFRIEPDERHSELTELLRDAIEWGIELRQAFQLEKECLREPFTSAETLREGPSAWKIWHARYALERFRNAFLDGVLAQLSKQLKHLGHREGALSLALSSMDDAPVFAHQGASAEELVGVFDEFSSFMKKCLLLLIQSYAGEPIRGAREVVTSPRTTSVPLGATVQPLSATPREARTIAEQLPPSRHVVAPPKTGRDTD